MYMPEASSPAFGVVRSLVKDSTDNGTSSAAFSFLDSNGLVGWVNSSAAAQQSGNRQLQQTLLGNAWIMLMLTTHPEGGKGFQIWVDGSLAAEETANGTYKSKCSAS